MKLPDYKNRGIVNLMATLAQTLGSKSKYQPLKFLNTKNFADKTIILIIIDGLGHSFLKKYGKKGFLYKNLKGKMISVFPSTTASAVTTFNTGLAPQEHALTGWFVFLRELEKVVAVLPLIPRGEEKPIKINTKIAKKIYNFKSFCENIRIPSYSITHRDYINSPYNKAIARGSKRVPCKSLASLFRQIRRITNENPKRKYIYAYWGGLDSICHRKGTDSLKARKHFWKLDKSVKSLNDFLKNKNAVVIITSDHGQINTKEKEKIIILENHLELKSCLEQPLSGEPRVAYCRVKKTKTKQFENYIRNNFQKICRMHKSGNLIRKNFFGLGKPNKKLVSRIGNYVLIMKSNYIIEDSVSGETGKNFIGNHGGMSSEEMYVPLIVLD
jgi:hypothetical protein